MRANLQKAAVVLLVLAGLYSLVHYWVSIKDLDTVATGAEAVDAWEARLEPAKRALPVNRGVIGYVADWDVPGIKYAFGDLEAEYFLSQYALAPLILVRGAQAEWNVAVLSPQAFEAWQQTNHGKFDVINLKHNVYLLHRLKDQ